MNILFVLYGDFYSNSANPLALYARELQSRGHTCAIAVPSNLESISLHDNPAFIPVLYGDVLASPDSVFPDGRPADVIHACTPREVVRNFVTSYMAMRPTPLVIYLEDNESWIATRALGLDEATLFIQSDTEISEKLPAALSHPFRYDSFIGLADAVAVIQDKLKIEVPPWVYCETVMPGVDLDFFSPRHSDISLREKYGIIEAERVIVYHGGLNQFTMPAIETLCMAVGLINRQGYSCKLLRSGPHPLSFLGRLPRDTTSAIRDLGVLPKHELPDLLALADVFVQPGQIDPFEDLRLPGKVPEFLAMGRPVVMPDVGISHLFKDGMDAVLLHSGSAEEIAAKCMDLFSDPRKAGMIGQAGRLLAEKYFDVKLQARRLEDVYKSACNNFSIEIASGVWQARHENNSVTSLLACKLRLLVDFRDKKSSGEVGELLREYARYIELMQQRVKGLTGRDGELTRLAQAVAERDAQIASLNQAVAERDAQIASLNQAVAERDAQIASLNQAVAERDREILAIRNTTSWRVTAPLRHIRSVFLRSKFAAPFVRRNIKRLQVVLAFLPAFVNSAGGILPAGLKAFRFIRREGWRGLVKRTLILQSQSGRPIDQAQHTAKAYKTYIAAMEPKDEDFEVMAQTVACFNYRPKFSIVVPVYNVDAKWLTRFIESVLAQVYPDWELCIADDHSTLPHVRPLLENFAAEDGRIRLVFRDTNGHIAAATNSALELATGDFMCLMDNDDEIAPHALYEFASLLNRNKSIDMIYSDEDKLDMGGNRYEPFFKPDWSPEALEGCMYTAHFACYRMSLVRVIGGFRGDFDGTQDYDFVLRFTERATKIAHIPKILYHWRAIPGSTAASMNAKDYVLDAALRALTERAKRVAGGGEAKLGLYSGSFDLRYKINGTPLVSIVIPSAGRMARVREKDIDLLAQAVSSIYEHTAYRNFEIIVVDNNDLRRDTLEALKPYGCRYVHFDGEFNIATKMNLGAREARGDYLLFMNDDIEVIAPDWLECMLQLCQRKGVGIVGAKLHFENEALQHVGVAFWNGLPDHIHREFPGTDPGHFFSAVANRNYLAVTGAVLMTKRELFEKVDGFDEQFAINYNDIDYCLRVFREGFRIVYAAGARLFHYESVSRERVVAPEEISLFQQKWLDTVSHDPYYSTFFDNHPPVFALRHEWPSPSTLDPIKSLVVSHR